jgi:hypothetical protein
MQRYETAITIDQPVIESETHRPVPFPEYVTQYSRMQRGNALMTVGGLIAAVAGVLYVDGLPGEFLTLAGIGLGIVGVFSISVAWEAHRRYGDEFAIARITHYRKPETVRPFNPTRNGHTIQVGRFSLTRDQWQRLYDAASSHGGQLIRDDATRIIPRRLYRSWTETADELRRLGLMKTDSNNIIPAAWDRLLRGEYPPAPDGISNENGA